MRHANQKNEIRKVIITKTKWNEWQTALNEEHSSWSRDESVNRCSANIASRVHIQNELKSIALIWALYILFTERIN